MNNNTAYQFEFDVMLKCLVVEYSSAFNFKVSMKRSSRTLESKNTMKYELSGKKEVEINEQLNVISTLAVKKDVINEFQEKNHKFFIQVFTKNGLKNAACSELNFSDYLQVNYLNMAINDKTNHIDLEFNKHPFTYLKLIYFTLWMIW